MQTFYMLNTATTISVPEQFSGLVVIYAKHEVAETADQQFELIQKLLENGMKVSLNRAIVVDVKKQPIRWASLRKQVPMRYVLLMGISPADIGLNINMSAYGAATVGEVVVITSQAPEIMSTSSELKGRLWKQITQSIPMPI